MQNGVNYQTKNANGKYIVVVTGEVRTCPKGASGKRMQFDDTKGKCACFDNGPAQTQCKDEPYLVAYIPFDNDFNDKSCNKLTGSHRGKPDFYDDIFILTVTHMHTRRAFSLV